MRIDFPSTEGGINEFNSYMEKFIGSGRMFLIITAKGEAILRPSVVSKIDTAYIHGLNNKQLEELESRFGKENTLHPVKVHWKDEIPEKVE